MSFHTRQGTLCYQLHGFSDAFQRSLCSCSLSQKQEDSEKDSVEVNLIASRTHVAPNKKQNILRLELLGATILARLLSAVKKSLQSMSLTLESYCWVDSFTTLCGLRMSASGNNTFRPEFMIICKLTWKDFPSKENSADIPSQSCTAIDLVNYELCWSGHHF